MAKDTKFGTFGGVFTPSILTILGVIMYLRLPWVVGNAGLYAAIGIIAVAHVVSVATGLSLGLIVFSVVKLAAGKGREVSWLLWVLTGVFVLRYVYLAMG